MKKLSEVVNVVPVIAKADSLTLEEREMFKQKVSTTSGGVGGGMALMNWRTYRSGQSYSIIASVSIHSTLMSMMKRRCNSTRTFGYVSVVLAVNVL
jgi:hypothetical protein